MREYLRATDVIDFDEPGVAALARELAAQATSPADVARACFEFVRDRIAHSADAQRNPVTCRASDVLRHATGYCYAKSHLLAALLRADGLPAGFCYQRLSVRGGGAPYSLHGFNAVWLHGAWYRVDGRGNKPGVHAAWSPPAEQLAFALEAPGEVEFAEVLVEPLPIVVETLRRHERWDALLEGLPDVTPQEFARYGLSVRHSADVRH